jgi:hypothetical protein
LGATPNDDNGSGYLMMRLRPWPTAPGVWFCFFSAFLCLLFVCAAVPLVRLVAGLDDLSLGVRPHWSGTDAGRFWETAVPEVRKLTARTPRGGPPAQKFAAMCRLFFRPPCGRCSDKSRKEGRERASQKKNRKRGTHRRGAQEWSGNAVASFLSGRRLMCDRRAAGREGRGRPKADEGRWRAAAAAAAAGPGLHAWQMPADRALHRLLPAVCLTVWPCVCAVDGRRPVRRAAAAGRKACGQMAQIGRWALIVRVG